MENTLEFLEKNHPRRFKIACKLVKSLEENSFEQTTENSWNKSSPRQSTTITLLVDGIEVYDREYPAREGWSKYKKAYTKELLSAKNSMMFYVGS